MVGLVKKRFLKLVCVDEIHLFVIFGATFWKEFTLLKLSFFRHLIDVSDPTSDIGCYLKVPLLLMTATFNPQLLRILQNRIGVKIAPQNYLWSSKCKMVRRNIRINVDFTTQRLRHTKGVSSATLVFNLEKCISYINTASCLEQMQGNIKLWLDMNDDIQGNALIINVDLKIEVKFGSAECFTYINDNPEELIDSNPFYPRIIIATTGSVGAGLDSPDVYAVYRVGFPNSIFEMAQELGRGGCGRTNDHATVTDNFHLFLTCDNYIYLNTRLYLPKRVVEAIISPVLFGQNEISIQQ